MKTLAVGNAGIKSMIFSFLVGVPELTHANLESANIETANNRQNVTLLIAIIKDVALYNSYGVFINGKAGDRFNKHV